jgi:hypothetical protein
MLQLKNNTPFAATMALFPDQRGIDTLYVMVKASFHIGREWTLLEKQLPLTAEDEYWGEPAQSSLKRASEFHIAKPATDIIINGHAHAPEAQEVRQMDVNMSLGHVARSLRVFGDRQWDNGRISSPQVFNSMPLVYEKAYGGVHVIDGVLQSTEMRNPVGLGHAGNRSVRDMDNMPLPNLENPAALIQRPSDKPAPSCFAIVAPNWEPRINHAGTYDDHWQQNRAPYLPEDFDWKFFNMAHPDLIYPGYVQGGEPVSISGMHPGDNLQFNIPHIKMVAQVFVRNRVENPVFNMESVVIEPDSLQLSMTWKAAMPCDKQAMKIRNINVNMSR